MGRLNGQNSIIDLSGNLSRARRKAGFSQMAVAEELGMSVQCYQKYEYGKSLLSSERLAHIAEILDVPLMEFFSDEQFPLIEEELRNDEHEVLLLFRKLDGLQKQKALQKLDELLEQQEREETSQ